jgi:CheY-like chemotaxis protein
VRVYLPANRKIVRDSKLKTDDLTGHQTVLIVDDEDLLLTMGQMVLSSYGYHVLTANTGHKALEILSKSDKHIDLVIVDLVMPQMTGRELIEHIRRLSPDTRIIRTSGYVRPASGEDGEDYLQKPFTTQDLLLKVKRMLTPVEST